MKNFKEWFYSEEGMAAGQTAPTAMPTPKITGPNPVAASQQLSKAVQGTLQDPRIPKIATSFKGNNQNQLAQNVVPVAQDWLKKNPGTTNSAPITAMDIANQMMPQMTIQQPQQPQQGMR